MTKEDEILLAAEEEFFNNGYDATSTAAIAKRAGVTHAMVNYYFRTKERLFVQILDNHMNELLQSLKRLMQADGDAMSVAKDAASVIFDKMNEDRCFPYLIIDISRTHPDFLLRYQDTFVTVCKERMSEHTQRFKHSISEGNAADYSTKDIYNTVLSLSIAPFLALPLLENVAGYEPGQTDAYLQARKAEMIRILEDRYSSR